MGAGMDIGAVGFDGVGVVTMVEEMVGRGWRRRRRRSSRRRWRAWYLLMLLLELGGQTADEPVAVRCRWRRGGRVYVCVGAVVASALGSVGRRRGIKVGGTVSRSPLLCGRLWSVAHEDIIVCPYSKIQEPSLNCFSRLGGRGLVREWARNRS